MRFEIVEFICVKEKDLTLKVPAFFCKLFFCYYTRGPCKLGQGGVKTAIPSIYPSSHSLSLRSAVTATKWNRCFDATLT